MDNPYHTAKQIAEPQVPEALYCTARHVSEVILAQ